MARAHRPDCDIDHSFDGDAPMRCHISWPGRPLSAPRVEPTVVQLAQVARDETIVGQLHQLVWPRAMDVRPDVCCVIGMFEVRHAQLHQVVDWVLMVTVRACATAGRAGDHSLVVMRTLAGIAKKQCACRCGASRAAFPCAAGPACSDGAQLPLGTPIELRHRNTSDVRPPGSASSKHR